MIRSAWRMLAAGALIAAAPAGSDGDAASYAVRLAVQPAAGAKAQRIALPAAILAASQSPDLADLRVFDARGRAMPIARVAPAAAAPRRTSLTALPILGPADALKVTGVSLRLDSAGRARVATLDGTIADRGDAVLLGVLFDARAITGGAQRLTLDADLPAAQPVTFTVEASRDLNSWRPLTEQVVYRPAQGPATAALSLDAPLAGDYLRVTWRGTARLLSPVTVRRALLVTRPVGGADLPGIAATVPRAAAGRTIDLQLPFATPIASLRVVPTGEDLVVPLRILGRRDREQPWTLLGTGTATRAAGTTRVIALREAAVRQVRIDAVPPASFTAPPALHIGFAPRAIVFLAAGPAPFTLAAGRVGAADSYLPLDSLTDNTAALPTARVATSPTAVLALDAIDVRGASRRTLLLWALLLAATVALGAMAWRLWRSNNATVGT